jgi:hypothetical protein
MALSLIDPAVLHRQAQQQDYELDKLPWAAGVDPARPFAPDRMGQLY